MQHSVLLVGLGNMGRKYLSKFEQLGLKPSLCDINPELQREFRNYTFYCLYEEVEKNPDTVFVMVNPKHHPSIAKHFLQRGSYVFLEKPPALSYKEFADLVGEFGGKNLGVSEIERYSYAVRGLNPKDLKVEKIEIFRLNRGRGYINPLWDLAWHDLYLLLYLFGEINVLSAEREGEYLYTLKGEVGKGIPFTLKVAWNYTPVRREWILKTDKGEVVLDFLNERRVENGVVTSERKGNDKLLEMVGDVLNRTYDGNSVERALTLLRELEKIAPAGEGF